MKRMNRRQRLATLIGIILGLVWFIVSTPIVSSGDSSKYLFDPAFLLFGWGLIAIMVFCLSKFTN